MSGLGLYATDVLALARKDLRLELRSLAQVEVDENLLHQGDNLALEIGDALEGSGLAFCHLVSRRPAAVEGSGLAFGHPVLRRPAAVTECKP